jgi:phosphoglycerate dehydrogenase-like enzyme
MPIADSLIIAHQMGDDFEKLLVPHLPEAVKLIGLPPERAWEVPEAASILLVVPPRGDRFVVPKAPPPGWPGNLKWIQSVSVGIDEYPSWMFQVPLVTCGRGNFSAPVAEFVLASILAVAKRFPQTWIHEAADWKRFDLDVASGKTLGLLGLGSIGKAIAQRAAPFGFRILAHRKKGGSSGMDGVEVTDLDSVLRAADHLVIALPLTAATRNQIGAREFGLVKRGVHFVNISRGAVVDHEALQAALNDGRVGFASLDVTEPEPLPADHPLYVHPRVHISPHTSYSGVDRKYFIDLFVSNLKRFLNAEELLERVSPELGY